MIQALMSQHSCSDLTRIASDTETLSYVDSSDFKKKPLEGYKFGVVRQATGAKYDSYFEVIHVR